MKKALVIAFLVIAGIGLTAAAGPLSGSWCVITEFDAFQPVNMAWFSSTLTLDYTTCGWTFGTTAIFAKHNFNNLFFEAEGSVGAFGFYGVLDFNPQTPSFKFMAGAVDVSIAGVSLYAIGMIYNGNWNNALPPDSGIGSIIGGYGVAGDCSIWVEAQFNMNSVLWAVNLLGYDWVVDQFVHYDSSTYCTGWNKPGLIALVQTDCCLCWTGLDIYVAYPFACFDLLTTVGFGCTTGFESVCFKIDDICLGIDWLILDDLDICFEVQTKSVCAQFELVLGDCVCFTPHLSLVMDQAGTGNNNFITGIALNALTIEYDMGQGVTFMAGTLFNNNWGDTGIAKVGDTASCDTAYDMGWTAAGGLSDEALCWIDFDYDEYFGVIIDGDACCGGAFSVSAFTWFDDDLTGAFMDWVETRASISVGVGSNTTLSTEISMLATGLNYVDLGVCFTF